MEQYSQLIRPRVVAAVAFGIVVASWTAGQRVPACWALVHTLVGAGLVILGASALNQWLEHRSDAKMARTATRVLPTGRMTDRQVTGLGIAASAAGFGYLLLTASPAVTAATAFSWIVYVWIYTPLKRLTVWQTPIGAVAGAMPVVIGAATAGATVSLMSLVLFAILYCWQFPHTMAIAWIYRHQYASAGVRLLTVVDPSGRSAAVLAVLGTVAALFASLIPPISGLVDWGYGAGALLLGAAYFACSLRFLLRTNEVSARLLLRASVIYLPVLFAALLVAVRL